MHRLLVLGATSLASLVACGWAGAWTWPADGPVLRPFTLGPDAYSAGQHRGIDVGGPEGSTIRAPAAGTVSFVGALPTHGRGVTILTADGYSVTLVHLGAATVAKGDSVEEGAPVGTMGRSGEAEHPVPSVHLGIRLTSQAEGYVDPLGLLPVRPPVPPPPAEQPASTPVPVPAPATTPAPPASAPGARAAAPSQPIPAPAAPDTPAPTQVHAQGDVPTTAPASTTTPEAVPSAAGTAVEEASPEPTAAARPDVPSVPFEPSGGITITHATAGASAAGSTAPADGVPDVADVAASSVSGRVGVGRARSFTIDPGSTASATRTVSSPLVARAAEPRLGSHGDRAEPQLRSDGARGIVRRRPEVGPVVSAAQADRAPAGAVVRTRSGGVVTRGPVLAAIPGAAVGSTVADLVSGTAVDAAGGSAPDLGVIGATLALIVLLTGAVARKATRRIDGNGAVLPHHADLLRQRDAAHRPRLHDGGRGRLRTPSTAARP